MLTRKKFIQKYKSDCNYYFDGYYRNNIDDFLNKIYDDFEQKIKAKDKEIEVLRAQRDGAIAVVQDHRAYTAKKCLEIKQRDEEIERLKEFEEMVEWMELNSNRSLCDYYNNKDNK